MKVFYCKCGYTFIIDLEAAKVIGPIYYSKFSDGNGHLFIGNNRQEIAMGAFRDFYGDCWANLLRSIPEGK